MSVAILAMLTVGIVAPSGCSTLSPSSPPQAFFVETGPHCCGNGLTLACRDSLHCYGFTPTRWRRWPTECEPPTAEVCPVSVPPCVTMPTEGAGQPTPVPPVPQPYTQPIPNSRLSSPVTPPDMQPAEPQETPPAVLPEAPKLPLPGQQLEEPGQHSGEEEKPHEANPDVRAYMPPEPSKPPLPPPPLTLPTIPPRQAAGNQTRSTVPSSPQFKTELPPEREPASPPREAAQNLQLLSFAEQDEHLPLAPLPGDYLPPAPLPQ